MKLHRTYDVQWEKNIAKETAHRRIAVYFTIDPTSITARDERGCECCVSIELPKDKARRPQNPEKILAQLGTTIYTYAGCDNHLPEAQFVPNSIIAEARKRLVKLLDSCQKATYKFDKRREENLSAEYPYKKLDYRDNVANSLAEKFYKEHGVADIERAMECGGEVGKIAGKEVIMTTRHCVLRELGMCLKSEVKANIRPKMPLTLTSGTNIKMYLFPDCKKCENIFTTNDKK